jgi:hypothetical protein
VKLNSSLRPRFDTEATTSVCWVASLAELLAYVKARAPARWQQVISRARGDAAALPCHGKYHRHSHSPAAMRHTLSRIWAPASSSRSTTSLGTRRNSTTRKWPNQSTQRHVSTTRGDPAALPSVKKELHQGPRQHRAEKVTVNWEVSCATREDLVPWLDFSLLGLRDRKVCMRGCRNDE